jgi:hypothetical protein
MQNIVGKQMVSPVNEVAHSGNLMFILIMFLCLTRSSPPLVQIIAVFYE